MIWHNSSKPFPKRKLLDSSKLKEFADNNFELDENNRKVSKQADNTVGKGEIACHEQFLLFPQCFQKSCTADTSKPGLVWERVNKQKYHCKYSFMCGCVWVFGFVCASVWIRLNHYFYDHVRISQ